VFHVNAGRFSTAWQLGTGDKSFSHNRRYHARSRSGTASLMVTRPAGRLSTPAVTNSQ